MMGNPSQQVCQCQELGEGGYEFIAIQNKLNITTEHCEILHV